MNMVYDGQSNVLLILFFTTNSLSKWRKSGSDLFFDCGDNPTIKHLFKVYHLMLKGLVLIFTIITYGIADFSTLRNISHIKSFTKFNSNLFFLQITGKSKDPQTMQRRNINIIIFENKE